MTKAQVIPIAVTVLLALAALAWQIRAWRKTGPDIEAELGIGQVDEDGVLSVEFASGETQILKLKEPPPDAHMPVSAKPKRPNKSAKGKAGETKAGMKPSAKQFRPVNAVFIHNAGRTAMTVRRCHYVSDFFQFEPQPGVSPWGDHLPKRIDPGDEAILVHDFTTMREFLNGVMHHEDVDESVFVLMLNLGASDEVLVNTCMHISRDMDEQELTEVNSRLVRTKMHSRGQFTRPTIFGRRRPIKRRIEG